MQGTSLSCLLNLWSTAMPSKPLLINARVSLADPAQPSMQTNLAGGELFSVSATSATSATIGRTVADTTSSANSGSKHKGLLDARLTRTFHGCFLLYDRSGSALKTGLTATESSSGISSSASFSCRTSGQRSTCAFSGAADGDLVGAMDKATLPGRPPTSPSSPSRTWRQGLVHAGSGCFS